MASKVKRARELFSGVSARDVAIVGGVAGAVGIGAYAIYVLSHQKIIDTYTTQYATVAADYLAELDQYVKQNGTGALTASQKGALDYKLGLMKQIQGSIDALAAQDLALYEKAIADAAIVLGIAVGLKYGPAAVQGFLDAIRSRGTPKTAEAYVQVFEGAQAVSLAAAGNVSLATAFYNITMAVDATTATVELAFQQATLQAELSSLSGASLIIAQIEIAAFAADILFIPQIFSFVPPFL